MIKKNFLLLCINNKNFLKRSLKKEIDEKKIDFLVIKSNYFFCKDFNKKINFLYSILSKKNLIFIVSNITTYSEYEVTLTIVKMIKKLKILSIFIKIQLLSFIGKKKIEYSEKRTMNIYEYVHALVILPKNKLLKILGKQTYLINFISLSNDIIEKVIYSIIGLIISPGLIKAEFSDIYMIIYKAKYCMIGFGTSSGSNRVKNALKKVYSNPLLEDIKLSNIKKILINITSDSNISIHEFNLIKNSIYSTFSKCTNIVIGTSIRKNIKSFLQICVIVTKIKYLKKERYRKNENMRTIENKKYYPFVATICSKK